MQYWFDRYQLLFSNRGGTFTGASYTDVNAVLPAKIILMCIAAICAIGFIVGAFTRSIKLPAIALGLLVLSSVLIGGVWPLVLQQVVVNPNGINREPAYIARNIEATRTAYGIRDDQINYIEYPGVLAGRPAGHHLATRTRCRTPACSTRTCCRRRSPSSSSCGTSTASPISWRWTATPSNGRTQDYVVAVRELNADGLNDAQKNWINEHMVFTHGDGFVAAPANTVVERLPGLRRLRHRQHRQREQPDSGRRSRGPTTAN